MTDSSPYKRIELKAVLILHERSIARFGGSRGLRDEGLLESALARPQNLLLYGEAVGPAELAAAYLVGIVRNHPFVDGNKRTGLAAALAFLVRNGFEFVCEQQELYALVMSVASGEVDDSAVAPWVAAHLSGTKT